jgi:hypothetical protein
MNRRWRRTLRVTSREVRLLVTAPEGDLVKARLDAHPCHPRALLTLLEGLSLWSGEPLRVALDASDYRPGWPSSMLFGDGDWPGESALVRFELVHRGRQRARLDGLGDFRALRRRAP